MTGQAAFGPFYANEDKEAGDRELTLDVAREEETQDKGRRA